MGEKELSPRIALLGFMLESNAFSPIADEAEFRQKHWLEGGAIVDDARSATPRDPGGFTGFCRAMDESGPWEPVPITMISAGASGCIDQAFFDRYVAMIGERLRAAPPLAGVYVQAHGAARGTADIDPEGTLFKAIRAIVGPSVPVVATLDLHANVSRAMVEQTDLLIAYLTNPHTDMKERGHEAGRAMRELVGGLRTAKAFVKLPMLPPQVALLSDRGPYGEAIAKGQARVKGAILNVSVLGNFSFGDSPKTGMSVVVTARDDPQAADRLARELAQDLWEQRHRFTPRLISIEEATRRMLEVGDDAGKPALLFADVADNPGGGGRGNTTAILKSFLDARVRCAAFAVHYEPRLVAEAYRLGRGARFTAVLNREDERSQRLEVAAQVMQTSAGEIVGRRGTIGGRRLSLGASAWLRLDGGIDLVIVSIRHQCLDTEMLEHLGLEVRALRGLVVKSRGHFRAGFDDIFADENILEVDGPGLATPVLTRVAWNEIPRPIWPLDPDMSWQVPDDIVVR
jgi:microcystin degradation protein MlrC